MRIVYGRPELHYGNFSPQGICTNRYSEDILLVRIEGYQTNHRFKNSEDGIVMWFLCFSENHF